MRKVNATYQLFTMALVILAIEALFWIAGFALWYFLPEFLPAIQYHNLEWAWALILLPVLSLLFLFLIFLKNRRLKRIADLDLIPFLIPEISSFKATARFLALRFALAFIILGIVDPKIGSKLEEVQTKGIDLVFVIDVSRSMLAEDVEPNRLERGKLAVQRMIERLQGDRVGLVVYAADAFVQMPLTQDYEAAKFFLKSISTNSVSVQGTALGNAIGLAADSFDPEAGTQKAIVVITDGENHEDNAIDAAERAAEQGIVTHVIGVGTREGKPIPIYRGNRQTDFIKDAEGNVVVSQMNQSLLQEVVDAGEGVFVKSDKSFVPMDGIMRSLNNMEEAELGTYSFTDYEHRHQIFFAIALAFLVLEILLSDRRSNWLNRSKS